MNYLNATVIRHKKSLHKSGAGKSCESVQPVRTYYLEKGGVIMEENKKTKKNKEPHKFIIEQHFPKYESEEEFEKAKVRIATEIYYCVHGVI